MKNLFVGILIVCLMVGFGSVASADKIKCSCAEKWSGDYRMQEYCINKQKEAKREFFKLALNYINREETRGSKKFFKKGFEEEGKICLRAMSKWKTNSSKCGSGSDWSMVLYEAKNQLSSYNKIK